MKLSYDRIIYDFVSDKPTVVLKDEEGKFFYFNISPHTALEIVNFKKNINSTHSNMKNVMLDLFRISQSEIEKITLEKHETQNYRGYLSLKNGINAFCYYLSLDDLILCSILFNKPVEADPVVFFDFMETVETEALPDGLKINNQFLKF